MEPLRDPKRQIRLLRLIPGAEDDDISCEISVHEFDKSTPAYLAISYTWGDTASPRAIIIDNKLRMVRQNCHYALWQARYHYPGAHIWMDAICIDQENLDEKSRQVSMMSKIFARATEVLACVGPDHDDSEFLWNFSHELSYRALYPEQVFAYTKMNTNLYPNSGVCCERLWARWEASNSVETLERLLKACDKFTRRAYWSRVWILQEVGLARAKKVLCGRFCLQWTVTRNLMLLQTLQKAADLFESNYSTFDIVSEWTPTTVWDINLMPPFRDFKCEDVRDRIFGTRVLLRFHNVKLRIEPDYSRCALELAMMIMRHHVPWNYTYSLLCLLEINMECPEFQALNAWRPHQDASIISEVPSHYHVKLKATRLRADGKGRLTCSLKSPFYLRQGLEMLDFVTSVSKHETVNKMLSECAKVYAGEELAFFLGNEAREGDYLAEVGFGPGLHLVLRHRTDKVFDIVCQGFSLSQHQICLGGHDCPTHDIAHDTLYHRYGAWFTTNLSVEDVVFFVGQDLLGGDEQGRHDLTARLRRVITPVSSRPGPIAIMKEVDCENDPQREDHPHDGEDEAQSDGVTGSNDSLESGDEMTPVKLEDQPQPSSRAGVLH